MSRPGPALLLLIALAAAAAGALGLALVGGLRALLVAPAANVVAACAGWLAATASSMPPNAFVGALVALVLLGRAAVLLVADVRRTRRKVARLSHERAASSRAVADAARRVGVVAEVQLLRTDDPVSFCYGYWLPRICVSDALAAGLSAEELEALLLHEAYHCRQRDPLKSLLADTVTRAFFFMPVLAGLRQRYLWARELAADRYAVDCQGGPAGLAGALLRVSAGPAVPALFPAASGDALTLIDARIDQLTGGEASAAPRLGRGPVVATGVWLVALVVAAGWIWTWQAGASPARAGPTASMMSAEMPASMMGGAGVPTWLPLAGAAALIGLVWMVSEKVMSARR